ncbi:MAG: DUF2141 domain-containing protein [Crocinitomicaceae bacterium]
MRIKTSLFLFSLVILISILSCKKKNNIPQPDPIENPQDTTGNTIDTLSKVVINLSGMQNTNGKVNVALYNSSSTFNDPNQAYRELFLDCTGSTMTITLDSLLQGEYAFAIFHDENNNQQIDQNLLSIPTEGFAFSNNAMGTFGPPNWTQSKFSVPASSTVNQNISLNFY